MADNEDDFGAHVPPFGLSLPEANDLLGELVLIVGLGLMPNDLRRKQEETGKLDPLLQLTCVRDGVEGGSGQYERLCRVVQGGANMVPDAIMKKAAGALVGDVNNRIRVRTRNERAAEALGVSMENFARRLRRPLLVAIAQGIVDLELDHRTSPTTDRGVTNFVAIPEPDVLARLEEHRGLAEELDALLGDLANWNRHRNRELVLSDERIENLHAASLYRIAYFECRYLRFERDRHKLWLLDNPKLEDLVEEHVWRLRLLTSFPEHLLAWLAIQIDEQELPNLYSFRRRLNSDEGRIVIPIWTALFEACHCKPPKIDSACALHQIEIHAASIVEIEQSDRLRLLGESGAISAGGVLIQRISTLRDVRPEPS